MLVSVGNNSSVCSTTSFNSMPPKRSFSDAMSSPAAPAQVFSPFLPMFEVFRAELDEHHDRRERIIKASRDITAASKKM